MQYAFRTILAVYMVIGGMFLVIKGYQLNRDTDSWIDRSQVAADREDMIEYLGHLKMNMEGLGMTHGHTALLFKTPINDMALHYKAVNRLLERLEQIKDIPKSDTAYQVALDDIRGTIRELPNPARGWLWVKYTWWMTLIGVMLGLAAFAEYVKEG